MLPLQVSLLNTFKIIAMENQIYDLFFFNWAFSASRHGIDNQTVLFHATSSIKNKPAKYFKAPS